PRPACKALSRQGSSFFRQQIQRVRQRPRRGTVAVARQGFAQRVHMATVLEQKRGSDRCIPRAHVNRGSVLVGIQEDFGQIAVLKPAYARCVMYAAMLEAEQFVPASVGKPAAGFCWAY